MTAYPAPDTTQELIYLRHKIQHAQSVAERFASLVVTAEAELADTRAEVYGLASNNAKLRKRAEAAEARIAAALAIYDRRDLGAAEAAGLVRRALTCDA